MKNRGLTARRAVFAAVGLIGTGLLSTAVFAQAQGAPGGGGGGQGRGGQNGRRGGRMTVASVPAATLAAGLMLSADQVSKIEVIQKPIMARQADMMKQFMAGRQGGATPDRAAMMANYQKMQADQTQAETDINALLTDTQKEQLPTLLKAIGALNQAGIPMQVQGKLGLTEDQKTQIIDVATRAQRKAREAAANAQPDDPANTPEARQKVQTEIEAQVDALLTPAQRQTVQQYRAANPRPMGRGGYGGGGRPGGGGQPGGGNGA